MKALDRKEVITTVAERIAANYTASEVPMYGSEVLLPEKKAVIAILERLQKLFFPAYFGDKCRLSMAPEAYSAMLLEQIAEMLTAQIGLALGRNRVKGQASALCNELISRLPAIQRMLITDLAANFDGDPAASSKEEVVFSYPGFYAIFIYRVAHELYRMQVPLIPRMMTEYAHSVTGIDINPGADIGEYFFIDHGTGVVIGETTVIGRHVKMYQGATLGALSPRSGHNAATGQRHPTVGDNVTIYAGATILGGQTVIGDDTVIGGNTFITTSVADASRVTIKSPELLFSERRQEE